MPDGPGGFTQDSSCPALLRIPLRFVSLRVRASHPLRTHFPERSTHEMSCDGAVLQPRPCRDRDGLGCSPFARHYWGNHVCFLFLQVLRCFSSLRWPPALRDGTPSRCRVFPFGHPRIKGHLHLPAAFRSLSRPSSPPRAKASAMRPFLLLAHAAPRPHAARASQPGTSYFVSMCQHVIERGAFLRLWRITDSNR